MPFKIRQILYGGTIGSGGSAVIRPAVDRDGNDLALKMPRTLYGSPELSSKESRKRVYDAHTQSILREKQFIGTCAHVNILSPVAIDVFGHSDAVMPLLGYHFADGTLATLLLGSPPSLVTSCFVALELTDALSYLHCERSSTDWIVHGDIKPANVFWRRFGRFSLGDFGAAHLTEPGTGETVVGLTPKYASPEQRQDGFVHPQDDIWSVGMLFLECLLGAEEVSAIVDTGGAASRTHVAERATSALRARGVCDEDIATILTVFLAARQDRPRDGQQLRAILAARAATPATPLTQALADAMRLRAAVSEAQRCEHDLRATIRLSANSPVGHLQKLDALLAEIASLSAPDHVFGLIDLWQANVALMAIRTWADGRISVNDQTLSTLFQNAATSVRAALERCPRNAHALFLLSKTAWLDFRHLTHAEEHLRASVLLLLDAIDILPRARYLRELTDRFSVLRKRSAAGFDASWSPALLERIEDTLIGRFGPFNHFGMGVNWKTSYRLDDLGALVFQCDLRLEGPDGELPSTAVQIVPTQITLGDAEVVDLTDPDELSRREVALHDRSVCELSAAAPMASRSFRIENVNGADLHHLLQKLPESICADVRWRRVNEGGAFVLCEETACDIHGRTVLRGYALPTSDHLPDPWFRGKLRVSASLDGVRNSDEHRVEVNPTELDFTHGDIPSTPLGEDVVITITPHLTDSCELRIQVVRQ